MYHVLTECHLTNKWTHLMIMVMRDVFEFFRLLFRLDLIVVVALMRLLLRLLLIFGFINAWVLFRPGQLNLKLHVNTVVLGFKVVVKINEKLFRVFEIVYSNCDDVQFVKLLWLDARNPLQMLLKLWDEWILQFFSLFTLFLLKLCNWIQIANH